MPFLAIIRSTEGPLPTGGALRRIEPDRHLGIADRPRRIRAEVFPQIPAIDHAALHQRERKHRRAVVDELTHEQLPKLVLAVLHAQLVDVEQVAATGQRIEHGDDLAPLAIRTQQTGDQRGVAGIDIDAVSLGAALVEQRA